MKPQIRPRLVASLAIVSLALGACSSNPTKQEIGTVTGAVVGGIVGSSISGGVATIGGAAAGSYVGYRIGGELDRADARKRAPQGANHESK